MAGRSLLLALVFWFTPIVVNAQGNLWFVEAVPTLSGVDEGLYLVGLAQVDLELEIAAQVLETAHRQPVTAQLDAIATDTAECNNVAALPTECVFPLTAIDFSADEIDVSRGGTTLVDVKGELGGLYTELTALLNPGDPLEGFDTAIATIFANFDCVERKNCMITALSPGGCAVAVDG